MIACNGEIKKATLETISQASIHQNIHIVKNYFQNIFTSFSPKFFLTIFLVKSKLSTAKKCQTAAFSRVFTQNNSTIESKLNFWTKNEDFEN